MGEHVAAGNGWLLSRHQLQLDALQSHTNGTMGSVMHRVIYPIITRASVGDVGPG
jgi:hypothetical protein